ncbi:MAG: polymerase sigma-70 factor, subfamily [Acidobacteriota bacterium]|jgi:RNA polymerase sigma-70 factor (ECF subfamily)|nr:polymerase sigma-70 factor, subfamily [Acidobacteriota bacterium]
MLHWDSKEDEINLGLIEKIQSGIEVEENVERLFELSFRPIYSYFARLGFSPQICRDLTEQVFLKVHHGLAAFHRESSFKIWLMTVAHDVYLSVTRKGSARYEVAERSRESVQGLWQHRDAGLWASVDALPPMTRQVFLLRYRNGYEYQEIAVLMKIKVETVKSHLRVARERLNLASGSNDEGREA